ncbi:hypothetical protein BKA61DRAFT_230000 [Leptodontidium sp. MPI-SDFR-AT-0119]|nr:hypothetical protein BKA61DRAFT_230000 [Leptodontidium sp. MPI-SDFR-AT-0119]
MEALAAASSVLAVVSVAVQLTSSIQKLISFWDSVVDAPAEVLEIKTHLRVLCEVLRAIEADSIQDQTEETGDVSLANDCLGICVSSVEKLEMLTRELDVGLQKRGVKRKWTCLKKVVKEKKVQSYWAEVERAKNMLLLYQGLRNGRRFDLTLRHITGISKFDKQIPAQNLGDHGLVSRSNFRVVAVPMTSRIFELQLSLGTLRIRLVKDTEERRTRSTSNLDLETSSGKYLLTVTFLPYKVLSSVLEFALGYQYNALRTSFQTFNLRPSSSPIFELCSIGDTKSVHMLIMDGKASPHDVDPDGWTPLHYAAAAQHAQLCAMLIELGAATTSLTLRQETPLFLTAKAQSPFAGHRLGFGGAELACIDTMRILIEKGNIDPMLSDRHGYTPVFEAAINQANAPLSWLMHQDRFLLDLGYSSHGGIRLAAFVSQRKALPSKVLSRLLRSGIKVNEPCARTWGYRYGMKIQGEKYPLHFMTCMA